MGLGGGKFNEFNKKLNGVYTRFITQGQPSSEAVRGLVAGGIVSDWAPDNQIFVINKDEFEADPVAITGYSYTDPKNQLLREIFAHAIQLYAYKLNKDCVKAQAAGVGEAKYSGAVGNGITVSVLKNIVDETKYDVTTYFNGVEKDIQTVPQKTEKTVSVAKKGDQSNESIDAPSATITAESNVVTVTYADMVSSYPTTATKVTKDGQTVEANIDIQSKGLVDTITFQEGTEDGTYKIEAVVKGADEKTLTSTEITKAESEYTKGGDTPGEAPEAPKATIDFADKDVSVSFSDTLAEYPSTLIEVEPKTGFTATSKKITFNEEAESTDYTIKAYLKKSSAEKKLLATIQATVTVDESGVAGADGTQLQDNTYVCFEDGIIEENAGYVFEGGASGESVTVADHTNFLNKLEGKTYNYLFYDGTDETIKAVYEEYTKRLRDTKGIYFQTILSNYAKADYEGIISIYNGVLNEEQVKTLTPWLAGLLSSLELDEEGTNRVYDGELKIDAGLTQSKMEVLINSGHFFFHETDVDEVSTYEDVNTFTSFTEDKNDEVGQNKVIRVVDYIHNTLSYQSRRQDIGKLNNTVDGRNLLWSRVENVLSELVTEGAIAPYLPTDIVVDTIPGQKDAVQIKLNITVNGTIRKIYITSYIIK